MSLNSLQGPSHSTTRGYPSEKTPKWKVLIKRASRSDGALNKSWARGLKQELPGRPFHRRGSDEAWVVLWFTLNRVTMIASWPCMITIWHYINVTFNHVILCRCINSPATYVIAFTSFSRHFKWQHSLAFVNSKWFCFLDGAIQVLSAQPFQSRDLRQLPVHYEAPKTCFLHERLLWHFASTVNRPFNYLSREDAPGVYTQNAYPPTHLSPGSLTLPTLTNYSPGRAWLRWFIGTDLSFVRRR